MGQVDEDRRTAQPARGATVAPMGTGDRGLTRHGQDRRADLLRHAQALFEERGYANTRMVDIARSAGVAKALCYWYFDSKEALFGEIMLAMRERLRAAQAEATADAPDPLVELYRGVVASVRFIIENFRMYGLIYRVASDPKFSDLVPSRDVHLKDTSDTMAAGQSQGLIRDDEDVRSLAHGTTGVVNQFVLQFATGSLGDDLDVAARTAARFVVRAVAVDDATATAAIATGAAPTDADPT